MPVVENAAHLLNAAPAGFVSFRDDGEMVAVNDTLLDLLGYARDELLGLHVERILGVAGRIFYQTHLFPLVRMQGWAEEIYVALRSSAGEGVPVLLNARRDEMDGEPITHCVVIRVKERKKYEDELLRAKKAAEEAHARERAAHGAKSHYLRSVSHEIRTPINALLGYADLLELNVGKPMGDEQLRYVERVRHAARHLLHIVNDVLDLAKIESGTMAVEVEPAELSGTIDDALAMVEPQAKEQEVRLVRPEGAGPGPFVGDQQRMVQVLLNLLSNAVKFTEPGGTVEVCWSPADEPDPAAEVEGPGPWLRVDVSDTGIGIPEDQLDDLFQPFKQILDADRDGRTGTGLGLTISREFARLMGGDITVQSEPGVGSTFTVWLRAAHEEARVHPGNGL